MGRQGDGVEVRETSIRLKFYLEPGAAPIKRTLMNGSLPVRPTPANIKYAHRLAVEIREKIRHGTFVMAEYFPNEGSTDQGPVLLGAQLDTWLGTQRIEASTRAAYESAVKFWKPQLGDRPLKTLKLSEILTALATRADLSGKTVNNYVSVLRQALDLALKDGAIKINPAAGVPRAKWQKEDPDPFSREEAEAIVAAARQDLPEPIANLIEWRFFTGVRTSEAAGLQWPRVDLPNARMVISEALVRGVEKSSTKTSVARQVNLNSRALAALQRQRKHTQIAGEHVWLDPRYGAPWTEERAFRRSYWTPMLEKLGIRYRPPNHMRHTYATMMLMAKRTPAWCARQMGHSVEMFYRIYTKWIDGAQDQFEMDGLEAWLDRPIERAGNDE